MKTKEDKTWNLVSKACDIANDPNTTKEEKDKIFGQMMNKYVKKFNKKQHEN